MLDSTGQIATRYVYDPFGVPVAGNGVANPWQFTGEAWDAGVELLYLRARYYQPETGRFITKDPRPGNVWRPGTLNRYVYVGNNPVNWVDPSGLQESWRVTPDWDEEETGTPTPGPGSTPTAGPSAIPTARPQPSRVPTPTPQPAATATGWEMENQLVNVLRSCYGIWMHNPYQLMFGAAWEYRQMDLVRQAASDFARRVEGENAGLKSRIAPVFLYKTEKELLLFGEPQRAYAWVGHIVAFAGQAHLWRDTPGQKWTVVHELAHAWDIKSGFRLSLGMLATGTWGATVRIDCDVPRSIRVAITDIQVREWRQGKGTKHLNPLEDWADAVAAYVYKEYADIKNWEISEGRWYYVADEMNPSNPERYLYPDEWRGIPFEETDVIVRR